MASIVRASKPNVTQCLDNSTDTAGISWTLPIPVVNSSAVAHSAD
jgi:hypothetical protein